MAFISMIDHFESGMYEFVPQIRAPSIPMDNSVSVGRLSDIRHAQKGPIGLDNFFIGITCWIVGSD